MYVFTQPIHCKQYVTQGQFLSGVLLNLYMLLLTLYNLKTSFISQKNSWQHIICINPTSLPGLGYDRSIFMWNLVGLK